MIVVIGGGPAGRYAAMRLAGAGRKVRLIERRKAGLGGQCLHQGCMTICALNDVARVIDQMRSYHALGFCNPLSGFSYQDLIIRMNEIIRIIAGVLEQETLHAGVEVTSGYTELRGRTLLVDGVETDYESVIVATGAHPKIPEIQGCCLPGIYTAHTLLTMPGLPKDLVIIGSGVIAAEFAYIFSQFGSRVTILARSTLLRSLPEALIVQARKDLGLVTIIEEVNVAGVTGSGSVTGVLIREKGGTREIPADAVLLATGMVPSTSFMSGFETDPDGGVVVDERMETSVSGIYAAGDVTGTGYLTPVARFQGRRAADAILGLTLEPDHAAVPQALKLKNDLAFCRISDCSGKGLSMPGPAGPGTFWDVPARHTGISTVSCSPDYFMTGLAEASPAASVAMAYLAWMMNSNIPITEFERFIEVHPSADGIPWLLKYLNGKKKE